MVEVTKEIIERLTKDTMDSFEKIYQKCANKLGITMDELQKQVYIYHLRNGRFKNINREPAN